MMLIQKLIPPRVFNSMNNNMKNKARVHKIHPAFIPNVLHIPKRSCRHNVYAIIYFFQHFHRIHSKLESAVSRAYTYKHLKYTHEREKTLTRERESTNLTTTKYKLANASCKTMQEKRFHVNRF